MCIEIGALLSFPFAFIVIIIVSRVVSGSCLIRECQDVIRLKQGVALTLSERHVGYY